MGYIAPSITASGITYGGLVFQGTSGHLETLINSQVGGANPSAGLSFGTNGTSTFGGIFTAAGGTISLNFTETNGYGETLPSVEAGPLVFTLQSNPTTAATFSVGGNSVGLLPAGGYLGNYTFVDTKTAGESTTGSTQSVAFTSGAGNTPTATFPGIPSWANFINFYLTPTNGVTGSEVLYQAGITTTTFVLSSNLWANGTTSSANARAFPTTNLTSVNQPLLTFPALQTGNVSRNLYTTNPAGGTTGSEMLYARGITTTTYTMTSAFPAANSTFPQPMPTVSTTSITANTELMKLLRAPEFKNLQDVYQKQVLTIYNYCRGEPMNHQQTLQVLRNCHAAFSMLATLCNEEATLVEANAGHLANMTTGIGNSAKKRFVP